MTRTGRATKHAVRVAAAKTATVITLGVYVCLSVLNTSGYAEDSGPPTKAPAKPVIAMDINDLCQHWVHSWEEQKDPDVKDQIFRPAASRAFPPSRFRMAYKFAQNGDCEWFYLSPDDGHRFKPGKWLIDATDKTLLKITTDGETKSYRIAELSKDILRLTPQ
jgi:hypothetical protein